MNARDELAELFSRIAYPETPEERDDAERAILHMLTPRTITTAEELDALPVGTVLLMSMTEREVIRRHERSWYATGEQWSTVSNKIALPATVLYEPQP